MRIIVNFLKHQKKKMKRFIQSNQSKCRNHTHLNGTIYFHWSPWTSVPMTGGDDAETLEGHNIILDK